MKAVLLVLVVVCLLCTMVSTPVYAYHGAWLEDWSDNDKRTLLGIVLLIIVGFCAAAILSGSSIGF